MTHPQFWNYADDDDDNEFIVYIYICYRVARYILQLYSNSTHLICSLSRPEAEGIESNFVV